MSRKTGPFVRRVPGGPGGLEPEKRLRIIGGQFRGRSLYYSGDPRTRPMKDRVREAVFNLLGPTVRGQYALDLFAGTGALGLEAISRGAVGATFIERHVPTARLLQQNAALLGLQTAVRVVTADTFFWGRAQVDDSAPPDRPWLVFCSPPYAFYVERREELLTLLRTLHQRAPAGSVFVVESDQRFSFDALADFGPWDVRAYPPAVVGIL